MRAIFLLIAGVPIVSCSRPVSYAEAREVVNRRCIQCHAQKPTSRAFPVAPQAVKFDTAAQMQQYAQRIRATAAVDRNMPIVNMTNMTDEERRILGGWVTQGAKVP